MSGSCSMGRVKRCIVICYFVKQIKLELVESVASEDIFFCSMSVTLSFQMLFLASCAVLPHGQVQACWLMFNGPISRKMTLNFMKFAV